MAKSYPNESLDHLLAIPESHTDNAGDDLQPNICEVLQILGAKWSFIVIAQLYNGPQRFKQLHRNVAIVRTQSLTDTLRHLEKTGVVRREVFPTVPVTVEYSLTEKGMDFHRVLEEMDRWAGKWKS